MLRCSHPEASLSLNEGREKKEGFGHDLWGKTKMKSWISHLWMYASSEQMCTTLIKAGLFLQQCHCSAQLNIQ